MENMKMTYNTNHLIALTTRLSNETARHGDNPAMSVYLAGIRKEIAQEEAFLESKGVKTYGGECDMSMEEIYDMLNDISEKVL